MIPKLFCLLGLISMLIQGRKASIVPVVETIPEITVTSGEEVLLKCAYERKPYAVFWGFESDLSSSDLLVVKHRFYPVGKRSGPGYDEGRFNITDDYSLLIHNVSVEDEGRYICNVADLKIGRVFSNYTDVAVTVHALKPLVRIHQCGSNYLVSVNVTDNPKASCMIHITRNQRYVRLDCFVEGAKPQVDMSWVNNNTRQDVLKGASLATTEGKREGTVDQILTVILEASEFQSEQEYYYFTCIAEGPAVGGRASVTIGINNVPPREPTSAIPTAAVSFKVVVEGVALVVMVVAAVVLISLLFWNKCKSQQHRTDDDHEMDNRTSTPINADLQMDNETSTLLNADLQMDTETSTLLNDDRPVDIETSTLLNDDRPVDIETSTLLDDDRPVDIETSTLLVDIETSTLLERAPDKRPSLLDTKRTEILSYSPDTPTTMNEDTGHINLGVFGLAKAGKSSLINSLVFSLKGNYPGEADSKATTSRESDSTGQRKEIELTDHIHIFNYKGMVNYDQTQLKDILYQIKGQSKEKTQKVPVDCTIFICDYRNHEQQSEKFMKILSNEVYRFFGRGVMLVIPGRGDVDDDEDKIKTKMSKIFGIPEDHVWIFENYTLESHEEDVERSVEFLNFILHCLTVAKENQQFRNLHYGKNIVKR